MPTLPPLSLSDSQRDELTQLLASNLGLGNIEWLAEQVLTPTEFEQLLRQSSDTDQMASQIVESIHQAGRMRAAFELLLGGSNRHGYLVVGLKKILAGESLTSGQQLQRFLSEFEPFLSSNKTTRLLPRVGRTICLVAVTKPEFMIMGTGFLIAHDIVITAHHVIEDYLDLDPATGEFVTVDDGKDLLFFFDYLLPPPPDPSAHQSAYAGACVHAANPWLIKARSKLPWDGTDKAPRKVVNEYDYVVIRLERSIGLQPPQRGMGRPRGWLPLVDTVDYNQTNRRLFLFQHPGSAEQQFDIGTYVRLDRSSSRVWYTVSAARGSSGGAAVDTDGNLFALHNAEVRFKVRGAAGELVNQGIRIDLIAKDVGALVPRDPVPDKFDQAYWSLSDDLNSARPILGRAEFRQAAARMMADEGERTLMVLGPPQSGRHFSISLFQRVFPDVPIVILKPDFLQQASPAALLRRVTEGLGIFRATTTAIPEPPATMSRERWVDPGPDAGCWKRLGPGNRAHEIPRPGGH
ncbi:MAG: serine protease [Isosphaeraceae bacterium]